jgi:uncharacterized protein
MSQIVEKLNVVSIYARVFPHCIDLFVEWQSELNALIAIFSGFVSLEVISPLKESEYWTIVQRFDNSENAALWLSSAQHQMLIKKLETIVFEDGIKETNGGESGLHGGITEVFVTEVNPQMDSEYRQWIAKIHKAEAKSPGFRGVYVQSPINQNSKNWITFLQFDSAENLDRWLASPERLAILNESKRMIKSLETQRVASSFAGWFGSVAKTGKMPSTWKQTMIVLLVLFPIVMLELKFLSPQLIKFNSSVATFIGNAISVTLIAWPMMPIAIRCLQWWLFPKGKSSPLKTFFGTGFIVALYLIEIMIFWNIL